MKCPICNVDLKMADRQGVEIDYCPQCRGVWLDRGELDKIIERSAQVEQRPAPQYAPNNDKPYADERRYSEDRRYDDNRRYDDDWDDHKSYPHGKPKKKSFLGDMFDIFD